MTTLIKATIVQPTDISDCTYILAEDLHHLADLALSRFGGDNTPELVSYDEHEELWFKAHEGDGSITRPEVTDEEVAHYIAEIFNVPVNYVEIDEYKAFEGAAACTAIRGLIGLSAKELSQILRVNERTIREWQQGVYKVNLRVVAMMEELRAEHDDLVNKYESMIDVGRLEVPYIPDGDRPLSWYRAALARVIDRHPQLSLTWQS